MKLTKIFAFALAALTLSACSSSDDYNTASGVTVEMQNATMLLPEDQPSSATFYYVPIVVNGDANGPIKVTVEVGEMGNPPATEGENYIITSKTITIPKGKNIGYVELYPKGDTEANENREFVMTIVKAEGAKIGTNATTTFTLLDNELMVQEAYQNFPGQYMCSVDDDGPAEYPVEITGVEEGQDGYLRDLYITGLSGMDWSAKCTFTCDPVTESISLIIAPGQMIGNITLQAYGLLDTYLFLGDADMYYYPKTELVGTTDPSIQEITFGDTFDGYCFFYLVAPHGTQSYLGVIASEFSVKLTRME